MKQDLQVFDFNQADELTELEAGKYLDKLENPKPDKSSILNYRVVQTYSQDFGVHKKERGDAPCADLDAIDIDCQCESTCTRSGVKEGKSGVDVASQLVLRSPDRVNLKQDKLGCRSFFSDLRSRNLSEEPSSPSTSQLNSVHSHSPSSSDSADTMSYNDETRNSLSLASPATDIEEDVSLNDQITSPFSRDTEMDMTVVVSPDYVVVRDKYCNEALVTFSSSGIYIKGSTICDNDGLLTFEWAVDDIIRIECQWFQRVGLVILKLHVLSKDVTQADSSYGASGVEELKFAIVEHKWSEKREKVTSLNVKYLAVWNDVLGECTTNEESSQGHYFPDFDEPFEEVVYPKGDSDAVSISKRDVDLLQPETFINDTIIDFYIKYLKNQIQPGDRHRFHFFNSFFFRKLADLDKDPSSISDGKAAFRRVRKWTRKVDMFEKDYVFIPVNFNLHWSLIVICYPGEVATLRDEDLDKLRVPCVLHMDSIKGSHAGLKSLVQSYLCEEWKERHKETSEDISSKFLNFRFVSLELPQQENSFDCGLFLLHYLELFLAEAPASFSPFKLTKSSTFLSSNWFPPAEASLKRTLIQKLIFELLENRSHEFRSNDQHEQSSKIPENDANETAEFLSKRCSSSTDCFEDQSNSQARQGIEVTLLASSPARDLQNVNDSGLVLREFFDPGATAGSLLGQFPTFDQPSSSFYDLNGDMSLTEQEDAETADQFVYLAPGENNFQHMNEIRAPAEDILFPSRGFQNETSWNTRGLLDEGEDEADSSSEELFSDSDDSDVVIIDDNLVAKETSMNQNRKTDEALVERLNGEFQIEDSYNPDGIRDNNNKNEKPNSNEEQNPTTLHHDANIPEKRSHEEEEDDDTEMLGNKEGSCNDLKMDGDDLLTESEEQRAAKRMRFTPPVEEENGGAGSLSEELCL